MSPKRMSRARLLDGVDALSAADPDLAAVVTRFGPPPLWARRPGFATLVQIILEQQVSLASGRATFGRLRDAWGEVTPGRFATLTTAQVRSAGVTRQKTSYCLGIARQIVDGRLDLRRLGRADDDAARRRLVEIPRRRALDRRHLSADGPRSPRRLAGTATSPSRPPPTRSNGYGAAPTRSGSGDSRPAGHPGGPSRRASCGTTTCRRGVNSSKDPGGSSVVNRPSFSKILISDTRGVGRWGPRAAAGVRGAAPSKY